MLLGGENVSNFNEYLDDENEDEDDIDNSQNEAYDEDDTSDQKSFQESAPQSKNPIKNFIKNPIGSIANGFKSIFNRKGKRSKIRDLWKKLPLKIKIAIIDGLALVVLVVVLVLVIGDITSKTAVTDRQNGVDKLNITDTSPESSKLALELYNKYDSLIGFTTDQLKVLYDTFKEDDSSGNKYLLSSGNKSFGSTFGEKFSVEENRTLYEHIQRTEKYNFNKIKWKSFTHTKDNVDLGVEERADLELLVPEGTDDATLSTLLKTTAPYLLTQDIPLGILSGMVAYSSSSTGEASTAENFTYEILKEAITKMTVHKYELESLKLRSSYDDINYNTYYTTYVVREYDNGYKEIVSSETAPILESTRNEKTPEVKIAGTEQYNYETFWYVAEAITYDRIISNSFDYQKYNSADVNSLTNPDSNNLVSTVEINERYQEINPIININNGDLKKPEDGSYTDHSYIHRYVQKEGMTYVYEKEWKDKLTVNESKSEVYTYNTAKEFNTKNNDNYSNIKTDKVLINEDKFVEDNPEGNNLFEDLTKEDTSTDLKGMSIIDLLNSNSGIYGKYIRGSSAYSEYQAISRGNLKQAYNQVKNILNVLVKRANSDDSDESDEIVINSYTSGHAVDGAVPFVYGSSLGYEVTDISMSSNSNSNYVSGMDLLKQFIRSHEGAGEQPVTTNSDGVECYTAYRDSGGKLTVGYGVNLDAHPDDKASLESKIGQTIDTGTLVPVELVDPIEEAKIKEVYDNVKSATNGLDLKEYQLHALTSLSYNGISIDKILMYYNDPAYWNEETDDKYEEVYEKYKDNQTAVSQIEAEADMTRGLYTNWLALNIHDSSGKELPGLVRRRRSEYILFSLGYYNTLQRFYTSGGIAPSGDVLVVNGQFDEAACLNLQKWFEENIFSGKIDNASSDLYAWKKVETTNNGVRDTDNRNAFNPAFSKYNYGSFYSECPWWSRIRANMFLEENGHEFLTDRTGNGYESAKFTANYLNINYYSGDQMNQLRANAVISFAATPRNSAGHVAYVEAVTDTHYIISHCGSGHLWHGLLILPKTKNPGISGVGQVVGFCNLDEAI